MSDVKVQQKQALSRQEAARFIRTLADGLGDDGRVTVQLGSSTLELSVAGQLDCGLEVAVDGDEIELELELTWSTSGRPSAEAAQEESEADELEEAGAGVEPEQGEREGEGVEEADSWEDPSEPDAADEEAAAGGASVDEAGESTEPESVSAPDVVPDQTARPRRGRRRASAEAGKSAFNGVDTAAVRAWAAANGVSVSPRGRIRDEVIEAYRAAGN